jgi:hypothetical protein
MGANKLKKMMKKMEDVLAATSFAEEGESDAARSILNEGRRVLLALKEGRIDVKTLKYAVNTSNKALPDGFLSVEDFKRRLCVIPERRGSKAFELCGSPSAR